MGRIKTLPVKRITKKLIETHREKFTEDFEKNKEVVNRLIKTQSKKLRNVIAGYVTRLVQEDKNPRKRRSVPIDDGTDA